ncbi:MAG: ribosomal subunit interface protein [Bacillus thermozeamaize]|uniref:Ribosome hibernation promoting factor n=1 Tax=Bacillus thermozeamaize TaxID=230954 RepID=A0A1Y3PUF1_9BACI|nr:MAG: ribosomal subunit interface protein [Bacillus thermozeamaize]
MRYIVRGDNVEVTPALQEYAEKKLSRLEKYFDDIPDDQMAQVTMRIVRNQHVVEVTVPVPNLLLRAEVRHQDMYAAIDLAADKLERQVRKYKTRVNRKARQVAAVPSTALFSRGEEEQESQPYEIVRTKRFNLKPMDVEEAILQMDLLGHDFFVFSNAETGQVSVVYKRDDGKYGLIETEA